MTELARNARPSGLRSRREELLVSAALGLALAATAVTHEEASAQNSSFGAFQGNPSFDPAKVDVVRGFQSDTITVKVPTAVINWSTFDIAGGTAPIDFLPVGHTGTFQGNPGATNFAVLNRVIPSGNVQRPIAFNGRVISQLRNAAGGPATAGGTVAFYSPGGIFIGSTAVFDVGSLLLTTLDPIVDANENFFVSGSLLQLRGVAGSTATITTADNSQINALANGSFVAMVSPSVQLGGDVRVNGSAAYIAAESVNVTVNQGLFDIQVLTGTTVANPIIHNATANTGGPASTGGTDNHKIYMVAVPKNQAITMTLQGAVGFDAATSATVENGEIILSAGHNVVGTGVGNGQFATNPVSSISANVNILGGTYTSDVRARATNDARASALASFGNAAGASITFNQDVTLIGSQRAFIEAQTGRTVTVLGNAAVSNARGDSADGFGAGDNGSAPGSVPTFGTEATIQATGTDSFIDIRGSARIDANRRGLSASDSTGGRAEIFAVGGRIEIDGAVNITASGNAGATGSGQDGPAGTGGRAGVQASSGATITLGSSLNITSNGLGGVRQGGTPTGSGVGTGGLAFIESFTNGTVNVAGAANLNASGFGGLTTAAGNGGRGVGGNARISASSGGTTNLTGTGSAFVNASGRGGNVSGAGNSGGDGVGGSASVFASGGNVNLTQTVQIAATGNGGVGLSANNGNGGNGTGGLAQIFAVDGRVQFTSASVFASGTGGNGAVGGTGTGGTNTSATTNPNAGAFASARRGQLIGNTLTLNAQGFGGAGVTGAGGAGVGGIAALTAFNGSFPGDNVTQDGPSEIRIGTVSANAQATGGAGAAGTPGGAGAAGGSATGGRGFVTAEAIGGTLAVTQLNIFAGATGGAGGAGGSSTSGQGGNGGAGGSAVGGFINFGQVSGGSDTPNAPKAGSATFGTVSAFVNGTGGNGGVGGFGGAGGTGGIGGNGAGGGAAILARGAALTVTNTASINSFGIGGIGGDSPGGAPAAGGRGAGGSVGAYFTTFFDTVANAPTAFGSTVNVNSLMLTANGVRFVRSGTGAVGVSDQVGDVQLDVIRSNVTIGTAQLNAFGAEDRNLAALGLTSAFVSPTNDRNYVRSDNGTLLFATANNGPGTLLVSTDGDLDFDAVGTGTIRATQEIDANVVGLLSFTHTDAPGGAVAVAAPVLSFTASDIEVGANVGNADTNELLLFADELGDDVTVLGGSTDEAGYTLTAAEAARLRANAIRFESDSIADGDAPVDILVRDLTIQGSAGGGAGRFDLVADKIRVEGLFDYVNVGAEDILSVNAVDRLEVITPSGGIRLTDATEALAGTLEIDTPYFVAADAVTAARLLANPDDPDRVTLLRTNNGTVEPLGYIRAGNIDVQLDTDNGDVDRPRFFVQNTGDAIALGGLTVGVGGTLTFNVTGPADGQTTVPNAEVIAFGLRQEALGGRTVNDAFFAEVDFGRTADPDDPNDFAVTYTAAAEFNTCNINTGCAAAPPPPPPAVGAFEGTPSFDSTRVNIVRSQNLDTITLTAPTAVINWTPNDNSGTGPIDFLPVGRTGIFQNGSSVSNFAVLNRVIPADTSRRVDFNGTVISRLRDSAGNVTGPGGTVAFYSPGGIFVSSTAVFDVGSLLLTSLDPINFDSINPASPLFQLRGASDSTSAVVTSAGSRIDASEAFVALVAPRLELAGAVRAADSVAYVAAESVDLGYNGFDFDNISVLTGTSVTDALTHTSGTRVSGRLSEDREILVVAVGQDNPITAVVQGSFGFDDNPGGILGFVTLLAGYDVSPPFPIDDVPVNSTPVNLRIGGGNTIFENAFVAADASGDITVDTVTATDVFSIDADGSAIFIGALSAPFIGVGSTDVDIRETASVGDETTESITFVARAAGQTVVLGGDAEGPGYTLTNAEASRLEAQSYQFFAGSEDDGSVRSDLVIRDFTIEGTGAAAGSVDSEFRFLNLNATGNIRVEGLINVVNAGTADRVSLDNGENEEFANRIEIVTPTGGIRVRDADGQPSGAIEISTAALFAGDTGLLAQLVANPDFEGRVQALRTNNGPVNPAGYLEADAITLIATDSSGTAGIGRIYLQNSGTATELAGLTVGEGGLTVGVRTDGELPLDLVGFGRQQNADGSFTTGNDFFARVNFTKVESDDEIGPTTYTALAEFNTCNVNNGCPSTPPPPPPGRGAFEGTPSFDPSEVDIVRTATLDTITLKAPTSIINWTPNDNEGTGPIDFLPVGRTGIFQNDLGLANFAVLNRVIPADASRRIDFNGRVVSQLRDAAGNVTGSGGTVAFYSPGGIFVSPTAVFDVGSLLLTALDPLTGDAGFSGTGFNLRGDSGSRSAIVLAAGSRINAPAEGSYVALVGPRIQQDGAVRVRGSAAYVAGEAVDLNVNNGLFDIRVLTGTSVAGNLTGVPETTAIWHTGTTGGSIVTGAEQRNRIYMVAVPKNELITTLLRGTIGFDQVTGSSVENGQVILSAGYNVARPFSGSGEPTVDTFPETQPLARISIADGANFTSNVRGAATQNADAIGNLTFTGDVSLQGRTGASLVANGGQTVSVGGAATITSNDIKNFTIANASVTREINSQGGSAQIAALDGGAVNIAGAATVSADAAAANNGITNVSGTATGGTAQIVTTGGRVTIGGATLVSATGRGGFGTATGAGNSGTGGNAFVNFGVSPAGTAGSGTFGSLTINASGTGGSASGGAGGAGTGGRAVLFAPGGTATTGVLSVSATGTGGFGANGGSGTGGRVELTAINGGVLNFGAANLNASGFGGVASDNAGSGVAQGGNVTVATRGTAGGQINGGNTILFVDGISQAASGGSSDANATAGTGQVDADTGSIGFAGLEISADGVANGTGTGTGGTAQVLGNGGAITIAGVSEATTPALNLTAIGVSNSTSAAAVGGAGTGGRVILTAQNGSVVAAPTTLLNAGGIGGAGVAGGVGRGGTSTAAAASGGRLNLQTSSQVAANGAGGAGTTGAGGLDQGGSANLLAGTNGTVAALNASVGANGTGGAGAAGGSGTGGVSLASARTGGTLQLTGTTIVNAGGAGGNPAGTQTGGAGRGGSSELFAVGGTVTGVNAVVLSDGRGGNGGGIGGAGTGGASVLGARGDDITATQAGTLTLTGTATGSASGFGGSGFTGGAAQGGSFLVAGGSSAGAGSINLQGVSAAARAVGGAGAFGGSGGTARGGTVTILDQPRNGTLRIVSATADASAIGGAGAANTSGTGGRGGDATGGTAEVQVTNSTTGSQAATGSATIGALLANSSATGGAGGAGAAASQGGAGGNGTGGASRITLRGGSLTGGAVQLLANGSGGASSAAGGIGSGGTAAISAAPRQGVAETQTLSLGSASLAANGVGGAGATAGASRYGEALIETADGNASFGAVTINAAGTAPRVTGSGETAVTAGPSAIRATRGNVQLGDTGVTVGGGFTFAAVGNGTIRSPGEISMDAGGTISVTHQQASTTAITVAAPFIRFSSTDLDIGQGARLGAEALNLDAIAGGRQVVLGGDTAGPGYTITQAEAERIEADGIEFETDGNVLIRNLTITGSAENDGVSSVSLDAGGDIRVEGILDFVDAGADDELDLRAGRIEVIAPTGAIRVSDVTGTRAAGTLRLDATDIVVATSTLADQLRTDPNFTGRAAALIAPSGPDNQIGNLVAGRLEIELSQPETGPARASNFFVQNSGTAANFAGITVGPGGLSIDVEEGDSDTLPPINVIAFGRGQNEDGSFITGNAFFADVDFGRISDPEDDRPAVVYTDLSTFNNCFINTGCTSSGRLSAASLSDVILGPLTTADSAIAGQDDGDGDGGPGGAFGSGFIGLIDAGQFGNESLIEDPVASGGDSTLWTDGEDDDDDEEDETAPVTEGSEP